MIVIVLMEVYEFDLESCLEFEYEKKYCGDHRRHHHHVKALLQGAKRRKRRSIFAFILDRFLIKSSCSGDNQRRKKCIVHTIERSRMLSSTILSPNQILFIYIDNNRIVKKPSSSITTVSKNKKERSNEKENVSFVCF